MFDVLIIGAGITGTLIARELMRYKLSVGVIEKCNDVGNVTSNANSAIVHSGYDPEPGSKKAYFNVRGNAMYTKLAQDLDVHFYRIGSLTVAVEEEQLETLKMLKERAKENGVEVQLLNHDEALALEPHLSKEVKGALFAPTAGVIDPFNLTVHSMENAMDNGAQLFLSEEVVDIKYDGHFFVKTKKNVYESRMVINAAGLYSAKIAQMIEPIDWHINPRKGEYFVLDHYSPDYVKHTIFPLPSAKGKGVLVSPTSSGNYIIGPSSEPIDNPDDVSTDGATLASIKAQASLMMASLPMHQTIRCFAGVRSTPSTHDFIIEPAKSNKHFINVAGIESPGLASSPAIANYVVEELVKPILNPEVNKDFNPCVRKHVVLFDLPLEERAKKVQEDKAYGDIVCLCEKISLGEIKDCLNRNCAPTTIKGLKRRVRAGYGKCQGGFCQNRTIMLLAEHYGVSPLDINYDSDHSPILMSEIKEVK